MKPYLTPEVQIYEIGPINILASSPSTDRCSECNHELYPGNHTEEGPWSHKGWCSQKP